MGETSSSATVLLVVLVAILLFIIIDIFFSSPSINKAAENKMPDRERNNFSNADRDKKRSRSLYWEHLDIIYDNKSNEVLAQAIPILQKMLTYHKPGVFSETNFHDVDLWYAELGKLRILLDFPLWTDEGLEVAGFEMPLFPDLDIQYINDILSERDIRNQRK